MKVKSNNQGICPFCGESNLEYGAIRFEGEMCYFPWKCLECKHEGEEWYSMEFVGHNVINENGDNIEIEDNMIEGGIDMYILYESYTDECKNLKDLLVNTKLIALYNNKEQAVMEYNNYLERTITQSDGEYDWFIQEVELDLLENKNILGACRVYNEGIEIHDYYYMIILEKIEVFDNAK